MEEARSRARRLGVGLAVGALGAYLALDLGLPTLVSFWGDRALLLPLAAIAGSLLWATRLRPLVAGATAGLGALWLVVAFTPAARLVGGGLVRSDPVRPGDAVLVLGSRIQPDEDPTPAAESRLLRGLELLAEGRAPRLVVTEQPPPEAAYAPTARRLMERFRLEGELVAVGPIRNTRDEAVAAGRLCRERGWRTLLVVTSPTHTRRACATVESEGLEVVCVPAVETQFDLEGLQRPYDRLALFGHILHERLGYWVYRRRGWIR